MLTSPPFIYDRETHRDDPLLRPILSTLIISLVSIQLMIGLTGCDESSSSDAERAGEMQMRGGEDQGGVMGGVMGGVIDGAGMMESSMGGDERAGEEMGGGPSSSIEDFSCGEGAGYSPGVQTFIERTQEWGLEGVMGTLLTVADINGDGWPDLVVRRGGARADLLEEDMTQRHTWVMLNRQGRFEDFTEASGFLQTRGSYPAKVGRPNWVVIFGDIDNDGDLDAYSGIDMRTPPTIEYNGASFAVNEERSELLFNDGQGHFELTHILDPIRRTRDEDVPSGASFIDYDRDGWLDLWMSQGGLGAALQDRLFKNDAFGEMRDVTLEVGLQTQPWDRLDDLNAGRAHTTAWSAGACDLNGDGTPDLIAGSYGRAPNHMWIGERTPEGGVSYLNHSVDSGYAYDDNLAWRDDQFARCYCQQNPMAEGCADAPSPQLQCGQNRWDHQTGRQPFRLGGNSGATVCDDLDGDGDLDLFTTEIHHWWGGQGSDSSEVLLNDGATLPTFIRPGREALGMTIDHPSPSWDEGHITAASIDFDNDGYRDLYLGATDYQGNKGLLYHNLTGLGEGPRFQEVSVSGGVSHNRSHGVAVADFDRDGDLDLIVGHSRMRCGDDSVTSCYPTMQVRAFENTKGNERSWVQLTLEGAEGSNRGAVGAWVEVLSNMETDEGGAQPARNVQVIQGGYGHFGQQKDATLHFGLGARCQAEVLIRWPDATLTEQRFTVDSRRRYHVVQGQAPRVIEE